MSSHWPRRDRQNAQVIVSAEPSGSSHAWVEMDVARPIERLVSRGTLSLVSGLPRLAIRYHYTGVHEVDGVLCL